MTYSPPESYATEKQIAFIVSLIEQRSLTPEVKAHVEAQVASDTMTKQEASKRIEWLLAQPKVEKPKPVYADVPEGMHISPETGVAVKVYRTRNGHVVASFLKEIDGAWGFEYQGKRGLKGLSEATRMPAEEAAKFGKTYGICINCAAHLTDERSIFAGYGPVCAKNNGWAYPTKDEAMKGLGVGIYADSAPISTPEGASSFWYDAATVEEAIANLDSTPSPKIEFLVSELADLAAMEAAVKDIPEQPDDFDEVVEESIGLKEATEGMEKAAEALESFAAVLKEHAILPITIDTSEPPSLADQLLPEDI